jgi:hypothetical protein
MAIAKRILTGARMLHGGLAGAGKQSRDKQRFSSMQASTGKKPVITKQIGTRGKRIKGTKKTRQTWRIR